MESIVEGKRQFIAAKVQIFFFFLPLATASESETSAKKKSIHLSSHKTSVFHRGNGKNFTLNWICEFLLGAGRGGQSGEGQAVLHPRTFSDLTAM
jgi:hypothetical protein